MVRYYAGTSMHKDKKGEYVAWEEVKAIFKVLHDQAVPGIDDDGLRLVRISDIIGAQLESNVVTKDMLFDLAYKKAVVHRRNK